MKIRKREGPTRAGVLMRVLIVESNAALATVWQDHISRQGHEALSVQSQDAAIEALMSGPFGIVVLDLVLDEGSAFAVADYASYRRPDAKVIFVTNTSFFSDGSIFQHMQNAAAFLPTGTRPEDLAQLVDYYGSEAQKPAVAGSA
jgi:DNA-binding NtrC family response regulator